MENTVLVVRCSSRLILSLKHLVRTDKLWRLFPIDLILIEFLVVFEKVSSISLGVIFCQEV